LNPRDELCADDRLSALPAAPKARRDDQQKFAEMSREGLRIAGLRSPLVGPFDLAVEHGAVAITGTSGSGKSLFLRMVADLDPNEGEVWLDGMRRSEMPAPSWRRRVVYSAAESGWWSESVADHFPGRTLDAARALAPRLALGSHLLEGPVTRLSSGEKLRLALIRALLLEPRALLLDEPSGALDQTTTRAVEDVLRERMDAGTILLLATHDPGQPARLAARHLHMVSGRLEEACSRSC
jgi:putative ABC transport system ATP-binding protein